MNPIYSISGGLGDLWAGVSLLKRLSIGRGEPIMAMAHASC
jgi:hypothetical protein